MVLAGAVLIWAVLIWAVLIWAVLISGPALAHTGGASAAGFTAGFMHPPSGLDHLLAMVSVGIWGAELGPPAIFLLPIVFPLIMALGGAAGVAGLPLPGAELLIAASVLVLGLLVASGRRVPLAAAIAIVGVFAVAHGYAHGTELPGAGDALAFTVGFVLSTGLLHLAGIAIGLLARWRGGVVALRVCGVLIAMTGAYFIYGHAGA